MNDVDLYSDASTEIAIGEEEGKVIVTFSKPTRWLVLDGENARQIGEAMARSAYKLKFGVPPITSAIKAHTRETLISRFLLVDRSLREQGKSSDYIAQTLVDLFLSEVT